MKLKKKTSKKVATKSTKKVASKSTKPAKREKKPGEVAVGVRWFYKKEFAKLLGKGGTGKGRARRNDVKVWAYSVLDKAAAALAEKDEEE